MTDFSFVENKIPTRLEGFNRLTGDVKHNRPGGFPQGTIVGLFGEAAMGKTSVNFQLAVDFLASTNRRVLLFDTEGSWDTYATYWETFKNRFGIPNDNGKGHNLENAVIVQGKYVQDPKTRQWMLQIPGYNPDAKKAEDRDKLPEKAIIVFECRNIRGILHAHGRGVNIKVKESKLAVLQDPNHWILDVYDTPLGKLVLDLGIGYISYDSISAPMKEFGIESQNLPQRAEATAYWMGPAQQLFAELNLCGTAIMHYMKDPTNIYGKVDPEGGKVLAHTFKYTLRMSGAKDKMRRKMQIYRHPGKAKDSEEAIFQFTPNGLVDVESD